AVVSDVRNFKNRAPGQSLIDCDVIVLCQRHSIVANLQPLDATSGTAGHVCNSRWVELRNLRQRSKTARGRHRSVGDSEWNLRRLLHGVEGDLIPKDSEAATDHRLSVTEDIER